MAARWDWWKRQYWLYGGVASLVLAVFSFVFWGLAPTHTTDEVLYAVMWLIFGVVFLFRHRHQGEAEHLDIGIHQNKKTESCPTTNRS